MNQDKKWKGRMGLFTLSIRVAALVSVVVGQAAWSQQPIAYPAKGQSPAQEDKDTGACQVWAKKKTGVDPVAIAQQPAAPPPGPAVGGGERVQGAARGAAGGAVIGAIGGDAGKGAATGAAVGTMVGGHRARKNRAAKQQSAEAQKQDKINTYNRAFAACMEGRGYTMK
jgi:OmpA family protein